MDDIKEEYPVEYIQVKAKDAEVAAKIQTNKFRYFIFLGNGERMDCGSDNRIDLYWNDFS